MTALKYTIEDGFRSWPPLREDVPIFALVEETYKICGNQDRAFLTYHYEPERIKNLPSNVKVLRWVYADHRYTDVNGYELRKRLVI